MMMIGTQRMKDEFELKNKDKVYVNNIIGRCGHSAKKVENSKKNSTAFKVR